MENSPEFYNSIQYKALTRKQQEFVKAYIANKGEVECMKASGCKTTSVPSIMNQFRAMFDRAAVVLALLYWYKHEEPPDRFKISMWRAAQRGGLEPKYMFAASRYERLMKGIKSVTTAISPKGTPEPKLGKKPEEAFSLGDFESQ